MAGSQPCEQCRRGGRREVSLWGDGPCLGFALGEKTRRGTRREGARGLSAPVQRHGRRCISWSTVSEFTISESGLILVKMSTMTLLWVPELRYQHLVGGAKIQRCEGMEAADAFSFYRASYQVVGLYV